MAYFFTLFLNYSTTRLLSCKVIHGVSLLTAKQAILPYSTNCSPMGFPNSCLVTQLKESPPLTWLAQAEHVHCPPATAWERARPTPSSCAGCGAPQARQASGWSRNSKAVFLIVSYFFGKRKTRPYRLFVPFCLVSQSTGKETRSYYVKEQLSHPLGLWISPQVEVLKQLWI